ncbi:MAG: replicative DNA helicase [Alphaproteobacteria bacterium]
MSIEAFPDSPPPDGGQTTRPREAPNNVEAEQELLGAILLNNEAFDRVSSFLEGSHFFEPLHGRIYEVAGRLITKGHVATAVTLRSAFEGDEAMAEVGGPAYLATLTGAATTIINVIDYAHVIYELALRRDLIRIGTSMVNTAYTPDEGEDGSLLIENAEQKLFSLAETGRREGGFVNFGQALTDSVENAARAYHREGHLAGISTGLNDLDKHLGGLHRSDLLIVAGRPSMGKTAFSTNIAFNAARLFEEEIDDAGRSLAKRGARVGFFSLEMSAEQLATRILSEQTNIFTDKIRRGDISMEEFERLSDAAAELEQVPLYIDDTPALSISALAARARRQKRQTGLDLIVVDYLQLLRPPGGGAGENRVQEVSQITQGLKALAKELDIPVIALSQLSRQVESRDDKRPQLSDLRESGSIEQDADVVMFVYREEYYVQRTEPSEGTPEHIEWQENMERVHGLAEAIIGKHRNGPVGTVKLSYQGQFARFGNLMPDDHLPDQLD